MVKTSPTARLSASDRRERLLDAALPLFARHGYGGTGTRPLAQAAGVTEPILYRHFANKADLFVAVLGRVEERISTAIRERLEGRRGVAARIEALGHGLPQILDRHRDELSILNAAAHEETTDEVRAAAAGVARRLGHLLEKAVGGGRPSARAQALGFLLLTVGVGAALLRPLALPELRDDRFNERAVALLLRGMA
jgi:AcrR family transcriptional regulator